MTRNIPLLIEYLAFFGLICCLLIYNTNTVSLSIIITFVTCEVLMEIFKIRLKRHISHIYTTLFIISSLITNIIFNGLHISAMFPVFFVAILLIVSQYIYVPEHRKQQQQEKAWKV
ncbi:MULTISPECIES: hypothetical protein [unclassified Bacillus (in: firmicutes)]|uniref:hypothetical protein n=1 Tax=unclassified Bacillus (in: firmicutes) TaxID=185979 RepID=UPI00232C0FAA|nr:hypothetical protein [Bacillus sp. BP-3]MDC2867626.1 hypothetical protein [Bacillus sp. BP-3]